MTTPIIQLAPDLRMLRCNNPSPMTYTGTNTYLLGHRNIAVIDPGPDNPDHLGAILDALTPDQQITHIIITHSHLDHSPNAAPLSDRTGAPIYAFGDSHTGRSTIMTQLADSGLAGGGEGVDASFAPDHCLADQDQIQTPEWTLTALHTPGHFGNHICLEWGGHLFCGDHVMGWASSLVSPPDGDLTDFMASCAKLRARPHRIYHPGHGDPIMDPVERLDWLTTHRLNREAQILASLETAPAAARDLAARIYTDVDPMLLPAAARNVFAHLIDLKQKNQVDQTGPIAFDSVFHCIS